MRFARYTLVPLTAVTAVPATPAAQPVPPPSASSHAPTSGTGAATPAPYALEGYAELYDQWNFNVPSNGLTNARGFDNRHNSFTVSNAVLDAHWDWANVVGRLALQVGQTPESYYLSEPVSAGGAGVGASGPGSWKFLQQAYVGYRVPLGRGLLVTAGLELSPIGPETIAVHNSWNWSRSNLFFGLPYYHTGLRASYPLDERWTVTVAVCNGWNSVVDNNAEKSVSAQLNYARPDRLTASVIYFGGVERASGAPEGRAWRHLVDAYATLYLGSRVALLAHADAGFEPNRFGLSGWIAGAASARVTIRDELAVVARVDGFREFVPSNASGRAGAIFWPVAWVASGTATIDYHPHEGISVRLEYRHDHAAEALYFGGDVAGDGETLAFVPNRRAQDTLTLGTTAWF